MDKSNLNTELFKRPEVAPLWTEVVSLHVKPYMEPLAEGRRNGGMMVWWVVIKESQHCGIVKKGITYEQAASLLVAACPDYFKSKESLTDSFKSINKAGRKHQRNDLEDEYGPEVRKLLISRVPQPRPALTASSSLLDVTVEIAETYVDNNYNRRSSFIRRAQRFEKGMNVVTPPVAIVTYPDAEAIRCDHPSSVLSFEGVDGELTESHVYDYIGRYSAFANRHHLILVARSLESDRVKTLIDERDFGLCIVNPDGTWHRLLSRSVNDFVAIEALHRALLGGCSEKLLIVYNNRNFTTLPELLQKFGVCVKRDSLLKRPYLSKVQIKQISADHLHEVGCDMNGYCVSDKNLADIASMLGVKFGFGYLPDYQLELCDFDANEITINLSLINNTNRGRFTLGHGFGHYALQKPYVDDYIYSFGENEHTLYSSPFRHTDYEWLEWQANQYGRYSLMPDEIMWNLVHHCFEPRTLRMGQLYVNDKQENIGPYLMTLRKMSKLSRVSMEALSYRLIEMGLLKDERKNKPVFTPVQPEPVYSVSPIIFP